MAAQVYELFFGTANAGGAPTFSRFARGDTGDPVTPPAITERGQGLYLFSWDWGLSPSTSIEYIATLNGVELFDSISGNPPPGTVAITPSTSPAQSMFDSAGTIITRAALQLGLGNFSDPYASTDPQILQLCEFLRQAGDDLNTEHDWTQLVREATFVTDGVSTSYALPADFHDFIDQSGWNRSAHLPLIGPLTSQDVQYMKARLINVLLQIAFRKVGGLLVFPVVPAANATVAFEYQSTNWVQSINASAPDKDAPNASTDTVLYDSDLMVAAVKLRWCEEKGWDTSAAQARYDEKLEHCIGKDTGGTVLSLGRRARPFDRLIDGRNVPEGSWGQ
jgi:hypothetical protein